MADRSAALAEWAAARGYRAAWGPIRAVEPIGDELRSRAARGEIDEAFARHQLSFDFDGALGRPAGWSAVIVVMPRPAHLVTLRPGRRRLDATLPPTYERYRPLFEDVRRDLLAGPLARCRVETLNVPLKGLAVRLGLARYGRNNLAYVPPFGSYIQLFGYATDGPLAVPPGWAPQRPRLLDRCARCRACRLSCPTGAIGADRVLLHGERCLTFANENAGAWPAWVPASAHECLLGCLRCQRVCPANPPLAVVSSGITFSASETAALIADGPHRGRAWNGIRAKLRRLGQWYSEPAVGRNVRALVGTEDAAS